MVNVILDKSLDGFKAQVDYGATTHGDGDDWHAAAAWGTGFADGRGHFIVGAEYQNTLGDRQLFGSARLVRGAVFDVQQHRLRDAGRPGYGQPHYVIGPNATSPIRARPGRSRPACSSSPAPAFAVTSRRSPARRSSSIRRAPRRFRSNSGRYSNGSFPIFGLPRQGGDQYATGNYDGTTLRPSVEKVSTLARAEFEISSAIKVSLEGSYARSEAVNPNATGAIGPFPFLLFDPFLLGYQIAPDNAFLPPAVAAIDPDGASLGRTFNNLQNARNETNNETWRLVAGAEGDIGGGWAWDAYYSHGENKNDQHLLHNMVQPLLRFALDAVRTPAGIVCGVTIPGRINPDTGFPYTASDVSFASSAGTCVPLNLFGAANADQRAIDYAYRNLVEFVNQTQDVAAFNVRGDLFAGWGPVRSSSRPARNGAARAAN